MNWDLNENSPNSIIHSDCENTRFDDSITHEATDHFSV
jgi:hypothetical protein